MSKQIFLDDTTSNDWTILEDCEHEELDSYFNDIDCEVACDTHCPKCKENMVYRGFWNKNRSRYKVALAVCYNCNFASSF